MQRSTKSFIAGLMASSLLLATPAFAGGHAAWKSVSDNSSIAFGSVKKDTVGEIHHFEGVAGTISEDGTVTVEVDLSSVETNIDIRNERMVKHVFQDGNATAIINGSVDMDEVSSIEPGQTGLVDIEAVLSFAGTDIDIEAELLVARLTENRVYVSTADFLMLSTEDLGITAGIDMLQKLAKLPGITRVTPVTIRMVFEK